MEFNIHYFLVVKPPGEYFLPVWYIMAQVFFIKIMFSLSGLSRRHSFTKRHISLYLHTYNMHMAYIHTYIGVHTCLL